MKNQNHQPATKGDLKKLATKEELKAAVKKLATKKELRLVKKDVSTLKKDVKGLKDEILAFKYEVDVKFEENKEAMHQFRDEIINHIDPVMKELKTSREEQIFLSHRQDRQGQKLNNHEKRITKLEHSPAFT